MPTILQAKLLRFLQDGTFIKVGGVKELHSNVRIISATNKNLEYMIQKKLFREDLYFRLNVLPINLPPLCHRKDDICILTLYFIHHFNKQYNMKKTVSTEVMNYLQDHSWPGNVRELKNTIERLMLISTSDQINIDDLTYSNFVTHQYNHIEKQEHIDLDDSRPSSLKKMVSEFELSIILQAVNKYGSIRKASKVLQVTPSTISRKINELNKK